MNFQIEHSSSNEKETYTRANYPQTAPGGGSAGVGQES